MCAIELIPKNVLAWNLYWDSKTPCASTISQLERIELSACEAADVAVKMRALAEKVNELEIRQAEQQNQDIKNASTTARH